MICPHCGAENSPRAEWCYLCESFFAPPPGQVADDAKREHDPNSITESTSPTDTPGDLPEQAQGYPPPQYGQDSGYPLGAMGALPPEHGAKATRTKSIKIMAIVIVMLVFIVVVGAALYLSLGRSASIGIPAPPGFETADEINYEATESGLTESGAVLDGLFINYDSGVMITAFHADIPYPDAPDGDDSEELENFFNEKKAEFTANSTKAFENNPVLQAFVYTYKTVRIACGATALHMSVGITGGMDPDSMTVDILVIIKGDTVYEIIIEGPYSDSRDEVLQFLMDNITI